MPGEEKTEAGAAGAEGAVESGAAGGEAGVAGAKAGAAGAERAGAGGESLLSQAGASVKTGEGGEDKAGEGAKEGEAPKEGEEEGESEKGNKPLTSADFSDAVPEGKVWDEELGKSFLDIVNESGIPPEAAKKMIALYSGQQDKMAAAEQAAEKAYREKALAEIAEWEKSAKADKEYGGQKWDASQAAIARGRDRLASPEAVAFIQEYKLGSHPEILRMFYRAGLLLGEDGGLAAAGGGGGKPDLAAAIFGESVKGLVTRGD
jgi:hypothetical protein